MKINIYEEIKKRLSHALSLCVTEKKLDLSTVRKIATRLARQKYQSIHIDNYSEFLRTLEAEYPVLQQHIDYIRAMIKEQSNSDEESEQIEIIKNSLLH